MKYDEYLKRLGGAIRKAREEKGITQVELSHRADIDRSSMNRIEQGKVNLSIVTLLKICEGLNMPLSDLFKFE